MVGRQHLEPNQSVDLCDRQGNVIPVNGRQRILQVNFQGLNLRLLRILFELLFLCQCTFASWLCLRHREVPLPQGVISVHHVLLLLRLSFPIVLLLFLNLDNLLRLFVRIQLDQEHFAFDLRVRMSQEYVPLVEVPHFLLRGHRKDAVLWKLGLGIRLLSCGCLPCRAMFRL